MARRQERRSGPYGPPANDWSKKARVVKDLRNQNNARNRRRPVYFPMWEETGKTMRANGKINNGIRREGLKLLSDLKNELRSYRGMGDRGRKAAEKLYLERTNPDGRYTDRPFFHIAARDKQALSDYRVVNFRSAHSDESWRLYLKQMGRLKGEMPEGYQLFMDRTGIRDRVLDRYFSRNPEAYRYD